MDNHDGVLGCLKRRSKGGQNNRGTTGIREKDIKGMIEQKEISKSFEGKVNLGSRKLGTPSN